MTAGANDTSLSKPRGADNMPNHWKNLRHELILSAIWCHVIVSADQRLIANLKALCCFNRCSHSLYLFIYMYFFILFFNLSCCFELRAEAAPLLLQRGTAFHGHMARTPASGGRKAFCCVIIYLVSCSFRPPSFWEWYCLFFCCCGCQ